MTLRELIYLVLDEIKGISDDFSFTEDHIAFLLDKHRCFLIKQKYLSQPKKSIPEVNYQEICLDLIKVPAISGEPCEGGEYLRSKNKIPFLLNFSPKVYPIDYYQGEITYTNRDRMKYVGYNKYLQNIIYCSISPDRYLYFKSCNPQHLYLKKVKLVGIFQDFIEASKLQCDINEDNCDIYDREFPIESSLVFNLVSLVVKELTGSIYRISDENNNSKDDIENKINNNG